MWAHLVAHTRTSMTTPSSLKLLQANFIIEFVFATLPLFAHSSSSFFFSFLRLQIADGNAETSHRGIRMGEHTEQISSSIQEMMAGPNTILNRTREDAQYKSILSPNDDHHLEHIFRARCCLDVWLSWGSLIHRTTHWSRVEVTFKQEREGAGNPKVNSELSMTVTTFRGSWITRF